MTGWAFRKSEQSTVLAARRVYRLARHRRGRCLDHRECRHQAGISQHGRGAGAADENELNVARTSRFQARARSVSSWATNRQRRAYEKAGFTFAEEKTRTRFRSRARDTGRDKICARYIVKKRSETKQMKRTLIFILMLLSTPAVAQISDPTVQQQTAPNSAPPSACANSHFYPALAVRLGHEGATQLVFTVNTDGTISDMRVAQSSGYPELDQASVEGAKCWTYKPATQDGHPVAVTWHATVNWRLKGD